MTWVKICGTTSLEDALLAVDAGADALGFVFADSPRRVTPEQVAAIVAKLPESVEKIGVFVNESADRIESMVRETGLTGVQLQGDESDNVMARVNAMHTTKGSKPRLYRAMHLPQRVEDELNVSFAWPEGEAQPDAILLDTAHAQKRGGSGQRFDWDAAVPLVELIQAHLPVMIAGGLNPENVAQAVRLFQPYGVDVVSGVEATPGKKDPEKVRAFIRAARNASVMV